MDLEIGGRLYRFHGGLPLEHGKAESLATAPGNAGWPPRLVVPLRQHQGPGARPVVAVGERIARGQLIGEQDADGHGARVHAPAGGRVVAVEPREVIGLPRREEPCVEIEVDPDAPEAWLAPLDDWATRPPEVLRARIREAGIVGLGGAVFPTHRKTNGSSKEPGTLVVNGAECEPFISCDETLLRHQADRVVEGARIAARALGAGRIVIAVEDQMGAVEPGLRAAIARSGSDGLAVVRVPTVYPEGGERQLIQVLTGREVPAGGTPLDLGMICLNVGTVAAVRDAVIAGRPLVSRMVTVTGSGVRAPRNLETLIGTPVAWLIAQAGGYAPGIRRLVMGGSMMGVPLPHDDLPVTKATNCLLGLDGEHLEGGGPEMPCIRCMACVPVCPARLMPQQLYWHVRAGNWDQAADHALDACIECGCCAVVCPSRIPLVDYYRHGKTELRIRSVERQRAEQARRRHVARSERLERTAAERDERLAERRTRLAARDRKAEIEAAVARARARKRSDPPEGDDAL